MDKTGISILAGVGGMLGWGTSDFFADLSSEKIGYLKTFFWSQVTGLLLSLLLIPFFGFFPIFNFLMVVFLVFASVFYALGYLYFYKGFEVGNVSVVSATINLYAVFTMLFAYIFLGQTLTVTQLFGIFWIILGVFLVTVNLKDLRRRKVNLSLGVKEALISSLVFGIFWNLSDVLSKDLGWLPTTILVKVGALILLVLYSFTVKKDISFPGKNPRLMLTVFMVGVLEVIGMSCVNFGINIGQTILVTPIASALTIVTISLAVLFLKEKLTKIQLFGILLAVVGIVITGI